MLLPENRWTFLLRRLAILFISRGNSPDERAGHSRRGVLATALALMVGTSACTAVPQDATTARPSAAPTTVATSPETDTPTSVPTLVPTTSSVGTQPPAATHIADPPFPLLATIPALQAAMENGELTSVDLVELFLARIAAYDGAGPKLNSLIFVNPAALDEAAALDAERASAGPRGPLHGIPIVVKDNINTADMPTTAGSTALEAFQPKDDAFQVRRLREAGAIIIAKSNLPEFGASWSTRSELGGQTLNPWDLARDPGGSSGGTAVAIAANFAAAGLGTDTCGSIRLPAGHGNLYGLRPSSGLSSRAGVIPLSSTLDTVGPMARNLEDVAIVLDATAGKDPDDPTTRPAEASYLPALDPNGLRGRRIGVVDFEATVQPPVGDVLDNALDAMTANGADLVAVSPPRPAYDLLLFIREHPSALNEFLAARPEAPVRSFAEIEPGEPMPNLDTETYRDTVKRRETFRKEVVAFMDDNDLDAIAYPVSPRVAAVVNGAQEPLDCDSAAYGGLPALAIPAGFTPEGLPVGLELYARPFDESMLITIASGYDAATDLEMLPPTTPPL